MKTFQELFCASFSNYMSKRRDVNIAIAIHLCHFPQTARMFEISKLDNPNLGNEDAYALYYNNFVTDKGKEKLALAVFYKTKETVTISLDSLKAGVAICSKRYIEALVAPERVSLFDLLYMVLFTDFLKDIEELVIRNRDLGMFQFSNLDIIRTNKGLI